MVVCVGNKVDDYENVSVEESPNSDWDIDTTSSSNYELETHSRKIATTDNESLTPAYHIDAIVKQEVDTVLEQENNDLHDDEPAWMENMEEDNNSLEDGNSLGLSDNFGGDDNDDIPSSVDNNFGAEETQMAEEGCRRSKRIAASSIVDKYVSSEEDERKDDYGKEDYTNNDINSDCNSGEEFEVFRKVSRKRARPAKLTLYPPTKRKRTKYMSAPPTMKEYSCHLCSVKAIGYKGLHQHYNNHHPEENRYTCKFCHKHFRDLRDCAIHQRKHTGEKPYKCPSCPCAFPCKKSLFSHISHIHSDDRSKITYPCTNCHEQFISKSTLNNHLISIHGGESIQKTYSGSRKPLKSWTCHLCDVVIKGHGPFLRHYADIHPEEKRYTCKFCNMHYRDLRDCTRHQLRHTGERPFPCPDCHKAFTDAKALRSHSRHMHRDGPLSYGYKYKCSTCGKTYCSKSALTGHMYVHSDALLFCKLCGKSYRNPSAFSKHNRAVHQGKAESSGLINNPTRETLESLDVPEPQATIKCHICWTSVSNKIFLKKHFEDQHPEHKGGLNTCKCGKKFDKYQECCKHAVRHFGNKNKTLQCDQCPQRFHTSTELRIHTERHIPVEERKNHVCDICGLKVVSEKALNKHKKKHDDSQPRWVCEQCGKSYSEKKGLAHHTKTEHLKILPFKCNECGKAFALRPDLMKHSRSHTKIKPFKCPMCPKSFPYTSSRARHVREVHNKQGEKQLPRKKKTAAGENREGSLATEQNHPATTTIEGVPIQVQHSAHHSVMDPEEIKPDVDIFLHQDEPRENVQ